MRCYFFNKYMIKDQECGYLTKNGRYIKLLTAGSYSFLKNRGYHVDIVSMTGEVETFGIPEEILMQDKAFAARVVKNTLPDECIAIRFVNKAYREVITKPESLFWNVYEKNEFQPIDITVSSMEDSLPRHYMESATTGLPNLKSWYSRWREQPLSSIPAPS